MTGEVTLVTRAGNEITASDPGAIGNLIGDGCRIKADPDPAPDEPAKAAETEAPPEPPKRQPKADTPEREASGR